MIHGKLCSSSRPRNRFCGVFKTFNFTRFKAKARAGSRKPFGKSLLSGILKKNKRDRWKFNLIRHYKLLDSFDRRRRPSKKIDCQSGGLYMLLISFPLLHAIPGSPNKCLSPNKFSRDTRNTLKREAPTPTFSRCLQGVYIVARNIGIGHFDSLVTTQAILGTFLALHTACTSHNTLTTAK